MVAISKADKLSVFVDKGHNPISKQQKGTRLINQDMKSFLCLALYGSNLLKSSMLFYILCTHSRTKVP